MEIKIESVEHKLYDKILYKGYLCSVARASKIGETPCIEFLEKNTESGWKRKEAPYNVDDNYVSVGTLDQFWNTYTGDMIELVSSEPVLPILF